MSNTLTDTGLTRTESIFSQIEPSLTGTLHNLSRSRRPTIRTRAERSGCLSDTAPQLSADELISGSIAPATLLRSLGSSNSGSVISGSESGSKLAETRPSKSVLVLHGRLQTKYVSLSQSEAK